MFKSLRFKLIKLLIGKCSVIANVNVYGKALSGNGLAYNSVFLSGEPDPSVYDKIHCDRLAVLKNATVVESNCVFIK